MRKALDDLNEWPTLSGEKNLKGIALERLKVRT